MITFILYIFIANNSSSQSSPLYNLGTEATRLDSQTVTFRDGPDQWAVSMKGSVDSTRHVTVHDDVSLASFFARPLAIYNATWTPGSTFSGTSFNPWSLFISNVRVANRMSNYKLFSGTMHLKFMVNGNSFYYGRLMCSYQPYFSYDIAASTTLGTVSSLVQNSQRLKLFVDPCESQAGEMELPFLWHNDMVDLPSGDFNYLGAVCIEELSGLKHANAAASPITLSVFAWLTDVKLSVPTAQDISGIGPQAGDEYGSSPISSIASSVARASGALSSVPMIGPYAKATSMAAGAMGSIAKMFGYSRPVDLTESRPMKIRPLGELACTDMPDGSVKLTVDSKQELTIDPKVVGLGSADEMALVSIAGRETYVNNFTWTTAATTDAFLFNARVGPVFSRNTNGTLGVYRTVPACTYASLPFSYWRGTMRYRFQIVASAFHKGRLKFVWDPNFLTAANETNVQYTKVVDIANERDFVIDVSWGQAKSWLTCYPIASVTAASVQSTTRFATADTRHNGVLGVFVLNELTTPNSAVNNDITINVFMSMCEDAEFSAPVSLSYISGLDSSVQPQSGIEVITPQADVENEQLDTNNAPQQEIATEEYVSCAPTSSVEDLVYMGEHISSLRQLIKRYNIDYHYATVSAGVYTLSTSDFPMKFGYTPYGIRGTSPSKYDVAMTTMMRFCALGFLFYRGGVRRKYMLQSNNTGSAYSAAYLTRNAGTNTMAAPTTTAVTITSANAISDSLTSLCPGGQEGMTVTTLRQNQVVEAELPFYRNVRFALCRRPNSVPTATTTIPFVEDMCHTFSCNVYGTTTATSFTSMVSAAEDSSFFCFQGCQPFYISPTLV